MNKLLAFCAAGLAIYTAVSYAQSLNAPSIPRFQIVAASYGGTRQGVYRIDTSSGAVSFCYTYDASTDANGSPQWTVQAPKYIYCATQQAK